MSDIKIVATPNAPAAVGPYSQAVEANGLLFVSGQLGMAPATGDLAEGFGAQCRQALDNVKAVVEAAGATLEQVLAVDVFVTDMGKFGELNGIYEEYFSVHKPARAAVEVAGLPKGGLVEFKCIVKK